MYPAAEKFIEMPETRMLCSGGCLRYKTVGRLASVDVCDGNSRCNFAYGRNRAVVIDSGYGVVGTRPLGALVGRVLGKHRLSTFSFHGRLPAVLTIETCCESVLIRISKDNFAKLLHRSHYRPLGLRRAVRAVVHART